MEKKTKHSAKRTRSASAKRVAARNERAGIQKSAATPKRRSAAKPATRDTGGCAANEPTPEQNCKRVRNFRSHAKTEISKSFSAIVTTLLKKSAGGSLGHTKLLFDVGGVKDESKRRGRGKKEPSLGALLLEELRKRQAEDAGAQTLASEVGCKAQTVPDGIAEERGEDCGAEQG